MDTRSRTGGTTVNNSSYFEDESKKHKSETSEILKENELKCGFEVQC